MIPEIFTAKSSCTNSFSIMKVFKLYENNKKLQQPECGHFSLIMCYSFQENFAANIICSVQYFFGETEQ